MKLTSKSFLLHVEEDIQIGELKATLIAIICGDKDHYDVDFGDIDNITYMGMSISGYDNWKKFKQFHLDMGIDFGARIEELFHQIFTRESVKKIVAKVNF